MQLVCVMRPTVNYKKIQGVFLTKNQVWEKVKVSELGPPEKFQVWKKVKVSELGPP